MFAVMFTTWRMGKKTYDSLLNPAFLVQLLLTGAFAWPVRVGSYGVHAERWQQLQPQPCLLSNHGGALLPTLVRLQVRRRGRLLLLLADPQRLQVALQLLQAGPRRRPPLQLHCCQLRRHLQHSIATAAAVLVACCADKLQR